jgi:hypothetical protein
MTLDCVFTQSRVISAHSWYLTAFVILSFIGLPFVSFLLPQKHSFDFFSSENTSLFWIVLTEYKRRILVFFLKDLFVVLGLNFILPRFSRNRVSHCSERVSHRRVFSPDLSFYLRSTDSNRIVKSLFQNLFLISPLARTSFVSIV